jgi:hypothetical protein
MLVYTVQTNGTDSATQRSASRLLRSISHVPSLKRHEINANYYGAKKMRGKIKTFARSQVPIRIGKSLRARPARVAG